MEGSNVLGMSIASLIEFITQLTGKVVEKIPEQFPRLVEYYGSMLVIYFHLSLFLFFLGLVITIISVTLTFLVHDDFELVSIPGVLLLIIGFVWAISAYMNLAKYQADPVIWTILKLVN